jgi:hypothetical protein
MDHKPKDDTINKLEQFTVALDRSYGSMKRLMWRSFVAGLFSALGATIGLAIVLTILAYTIHALQLIPIIGDLIHQSHVEQILPGKNK